MSHSLSYYNFRMMRYLSRGFHPYSFDVAYGAMQRNFVTHYILRRFLELSWARVVLLSDEEKYDLVNAFLSKFWYVADYRQCNDLIGAILRPAMAGVNASPAPGSRGRQGERTGRAVVRNWRRDYAVTSRAVRARTFAQATISLMRA